jgi:hypothetical protein
MPPEIQAEFLSQLSDGLLKHLVYSNSVIGKALSSLDNSKTEPDSSIFLTVSRRAPSSINTRRLRWMPLLVQLHPLSDRSRESNDDKAGFAWC